MRQTLIILAVLIAIANLTSANPVCTTNTMAYYMATYKDATTGCMVDDKLFYNFNYSGTQSPGTGTPGSVLAPTSSQVMVTGSLLNPNEPGLVFTAPNGSGGTLWSVNGTSILSSPLYIDSNISFTVAVIGGLPNITDAFLDFAGHFAVSGRGLATIGETVVFDGGTSSIGLGVDSNVGPFSQTVNFTGVSFVRVSKDLLVTVPRSRSGPQVGSASITQFTEGFSEGPEPISTVLFGSGLVGIGLLRLRRR